LWRFYYLLARTLKRTGPSTTTFTGIITTGITAIGRPGSGTRVIGSNGAEPNVRGWTTLMRIAKLKADSRSKQFTCSPEEWPQVNHQNAFIRSANEARSRITEITSMELAKKKLRPVIIDVREEEEFLTGHIRGAKHISRGSLKERIGHVVSDLTTPILVYCPRGDRGALATDSLRKMGYRNVYSLKGGLQHWLEAGGTLECPASRRKTSAQISHATRIQKLVAGSAGAPELTLGAKALMDALPVWLMRKTASNILLI
jgi:phage shock protein E